MLRIVAGGPASRSAGHRPAAQVRAGISSAPATLPVRRVAVRRTFFPLPPQSQPIMPVQAIDHINIRAPAALVGEMKDFYQRVLGLSSGWRPPFKSRGHWLYLEDKPIVHLVEDEK